MRRIGPSKVVRGDAATNLFDKAKVFFLEFHKPRRIGRCRKPQDVPRPPGFLGHDFLGFIKMDHRKEKLGKRPRPSHPGLLKRESERRVPRFVVRQHVPRKMGAHRAVHPIMSGVRMNIGSKDQRQRHRRAQGVHNAHARLRDGITDDRFVRIQIRCYNVEPRYVDQSCIFASRFDPLEDALQFANECGSVVETPGRRDGHEIHDVHIAKRAVIGAYHKFLHGDGGLCESQQRGQESARGRPPILGYVSQSVARFKFYERLKKDEASCPSSAKDETRR